MELCRDQALAHESPAITSAAGKTTFSWSLWLQRLDVEADNDATPRCYSLERLLRVLRHMW